MHTTMKSTHLLVSLFFLYSGLSAQNIGIHAESVGEWQSTQYFSPEYHYNSVAVFLLNEEKLADLFDPDNFSSRERRQTGIRRFDELESLYFSLEMPNPLREDDMITFPLYAFDIANTKSFSVPRNQGKIIDKITDEELNGRSLEAKARIEAVKKNQLLEVAYQISSSINKILGDNIFQDPSIWGVMRKAQDYFEDKYRGKIVSEFNIPILPANNNYQYRLHTASLYQIKWNFQDEVKAYKGNVWSDLLSEKELNEQDLRDKPTRLAKLRQHPYLLVVRYKSAYTLPEEHKLNVEISAAYLDSRMSNLVEFQKGSIQYRTEEAFLTILRDAIDLKRNCEQYRRGKEKGIEDKDLILKIAQQHYELLTAHQKELSLNEKDPDRRQYFMDNYEISYYKLFKLVDNLLFLDQQLKETGKVADHLLDITEKDLASLSETEIYNDLKKLSPYRQITAGVKDIKGELFYKVRDKIYTLENTLYQRTFNLPKLNKEEQIRQLKAFKARYALCSFCSKEADSKMQQVQQSIDDEIRGELFMLQNRQLQIRKCIADIQKQAFENLEKRYPQPDSLNLLDRRLFESYAGRIRQLEVLAMRFQDIEHLGIQKLDSQRLADVLKEHEATLSECQAQACQLYFGSIITEERFNCLEGDCNWVSP